MTSILVAAGLEEQHTTVRVRLAPDLLTLWFLRPELANRLIAVHGEAATQALMKQVTHLFFRAGSHRPTQTPPLPARVRP